MPTSRSANLPSRGTSASCASTGSSAPRPEAQRRVYSLDPTPLAELDDWLGRYRAFWAQRLDALETELRRSRKEQPMTELTADVGSLRNDDERCAVRFERLYDFTPSELWSAITDPARLARWLAQAQVDPGAGGQVRLAFEEGETEGRILTWDEPRVLEYEWRFTGEDESVVRFELQPQEYGDAARARPPPPRPHRRHGLRGRLACAPRRARGNDRARGLAAAVRGAAAHVP